MFGKPASILKRFGSVLSVVLYCTDLLVVATAWIGAYLLTSHSQILQGDFSNLSVPRPHLLFLPVVLFVFTLVFKFLHIYRAKRDQTIYREQSAIVRAVLLAVLFVYGVSHLAFQQDPGRFFTLAFWLLSTIFLLLSRTGIRTFLRSIRKRGYNLRYVVLVGAGRNGRNVLQEIRDNPWLGLVVVGFIDNGYQVGQKIDGERVLGKIGDLKTLVRQYSIDQVFITLPAKKIGLIETIAEGLLDEVVSIRIVPEIFAKGRIREYDIDSISTLPVFTVHSNPIDNAYWLAMKRLVDILFSLLALIVFGPMMLFIALIVKMSSNGPVFYKQERVGHNGRPFTMLKFRTMRVSTETEAQELAKAHDVTELFTKVDDPRKTHFGSFLRRTSLDEFPQFLNVLKGDMSIVGPRPERPLIVEQLKYEYPQYSQRHKIKTGITGWAQINGWRGNTSLEKRVEHDLYYIKHWSLFFDIKIMLLTVVRGFVNKNAY